MCPCPPFFFNRSSVDRFAFFKAYLSCVPGGAVFLSCMKRRSLTTIPKVASAFSPLLRCGADAELFSIPSSQTCGFSPHRRNGLDHMNRLCPKDEHSPPLFPSPWQSYSPQPALPKNLSSFNSLFPPPRQKEILHPANSAVLTSHKREQILRVSPFKPLRLCHNFGFGTQRVHRLPFLSFPGGSPYCDHHSLLAAAFE